MAAADVMYVASCVLALSLKGDMTSVVASPEMAGIGSLGGFDRRMILPIASGES